MDTPSASMLVKPHECALVASWKRTRRVHKLTLTASSSFAFVMAADAAMTVLQSWKNGDGQLGRAVGLARAMV